VKSDSTQQHVFWCHTDVFGNQIHLKTKQAQNRHLQANQQKLNHYNFKAADSTSMFGPPKQFCG